MIPVNEENFCKGPIVDNNNNKKNQNQKKKTDPCSKRFCNECLQKYNKDSWLQKQKNPDSWICPFCMENCTCSQCTRKRTKEGQLKNQFLAQFDQPEKQQSKRQEKLLEKMQKNQKKNQIQSQPVIEIKRGHKKQIQITQSGGSHQNSNHFNQSHCYDNNHRHHNQGSGSKSQSQNYHNNQKDGVKHAITDDDWKAYQQAKTNFYQCLNKYDWSQDIPALELMKNNLKKYNLTESYLVNQRGENDMIK